MGPYLPKNLFENILVDFFERRWPRVGMRGWAIGLTSDPHRVAVMLKIDFFRKGFEI